MRRNSGSVVLMTHERLRVVVFGGLAGLFVATVAFSPRGIVGALLFAVVVVLVGIWFFRFAPYGDIWATAGNRGINPWLVVILVLALAIAGLALRLGLAAVSG